jgi:hypothetical protein
VEWCSSKKVINGSAVTVTAAAGMILASLVIRDVCSRFPAPRETSSMEEPLQAAALPSHG